MVYQKDLDFLKKWAKLLNNIGDVVGKKPKDLNSILFLIGIQELGSGRGKFTKEEKQDLIHLGICKTLSLAGFYRLVSVDQEGWPHWEVAKKIPKISKIEQEKLLKIQIIEYFEKEIGMHITP